MSRQRLRRLAGHLPVFCFYAFAGKLNQFDVAHHRGVAFAGPDLDDAGVTAISVSVFGRDIVEKVFYYRLIHHIRHSQPASGQIALFAQGDHFLSGAAQLFGLLLSGLNPAAADQSRGQMPHQRPALAGVSA